MSSINVYSCKDIVIKVFIIGYQKRGESIILLFYDNRNNQVLYSIVIDSFKYSNINKTIDILREYNITKINMLCWSHPDLDHTLGIDDIIKSYCDQTTKIILPFSLTDPSFNSYRCNKQDKEYLDYIFSLNIISKESCVTSCVAPKQFSRIEDFKISGIDESISVNIDSLSPHSSYLNYLISSRGKIEKNQLSVVISVSVNAYRFIFCSDIENDAIKFLKDEYFDNPMFLKIPHHGSPSSIELIDLLKTSLSNTIGCSTIYRNHRLPNNDVLNKYGERCTQVDCTGTNENEMFGSVEYNFDLFDRMMCDVYYHGHAFNYS